jgi:hypothetical protein
LAKCLYISFLTIAVLYFDHDIGLCILLFFRLLEVSVSGLLEQVKLKRACTVLIALLLRKQNTSSTLRYIHFHMFTIIFLLLIGVYVLEYPVLYFSL